MRTPAFLLCASNQPRTNFWRSVPPKVSFLAEGIARQVGEHFHSSWPLPWTTRCRTRVPHTMAAPRTAILAFEVGADKSKTPQLCVPHHTGGHLTPRTLLPILRGAAAGSDLHGPPCTGRHTHHIGWFFITRIVPMRCDMQTSSPAGSHLETVPPSQLME
ncbi:hypothetical protein CC79DRAFT_462037 [Sarocladium strictum]